MSARWDEMVSWVQWGRWRLSLLARHPAGRLGILLGLLLLVIMAGLAWRTAQGRLQQQRQMLIRLHLAPPALAVEQPSALAQFDALLVARPALAPLLQDLLERGQALGLSMRQGRYRMQADRAGGFARYHLSLPATGEAAQVTRFIEQALQAHPALALVGAQLARASTGKPRAELAIEARLEWVVMVSPGAAEELR